MPSEPSYKTRDDLAAGRFGPVRVFDEIDSTNRYLLDAARAGAGAGLVAVARHQTAGRGRRGRAWEAPPDSALLTSVLVAPDGIAGDVVPMLTLAAGVAMAQTVGAVTGVDCALKWPNDLRLGDRKLGGILTESLAESGATVAVVVGIGLNLRAAALSAEVADVAVSLEEAGATAGVDEVLPAFLRAFDAPIGALESGQTGELLDAYTTLCATLGKRVRAETPTGPVEGVATSVDPDGALIVDGRRVTSGEVVHVRDQLW